MTPFSNDRTRRNTTFVAMLVWVFAQASGRANACQLETPGKNAHIGASHASDAHHAHAGDALVGDIDPIDIATAVDHDSDADAPKESSLKACDDGSNAQSKLQAGVDLTDPGLALFVVFAWNATTPVVSAPTRFDDLQIPVIRPPL